jgi:DNA-binding response OmpR family regulator
MSWVDRIVLLVDGSATLRYYYAILLKRLEFTVMVAESAEEALALMENTVPSLILTDIVLPKMSGIDFINTVKRSDRMKQIPVIVLADRDDPALRSACRAMGCLDFFVKRVDPGHLYRSIQSALVSKPREHIRFSIPLKVVAGDGTSQGGAERTEFATTISEGGIYLRTLFPRPKKSSTPLKIHIKGRSIKAKATVVHSRSMEGGVFREPGMGMQFVEISSEDRNFIRHFIKEQLTSDIVIGL